MMHKQFRIFDLLLIVAFIFSLMLPLLFMHNRDSSAIEKRKLAKLPQLISNRKIVLTKTFPSQFEAFFNDHFGLRDQLAQIYSLLSYKLKSSSNQNVLIGKDGWFFYVKSTDGNSLEDYRGNDSLTPDDLWQWKAVLEAKYEWLKQEGIEYFFIIAPDKHSIYGEYFPSRFRKVGKQSRLDQLLLYMKDSQVPILDLRGPLILAKSRGLIYYKTDTHWNALGAAIAQSFIMQHLSKGSFIFQPRDFGNEHFKWVQKSSGDLAQMLNLSTNLKELSPILYKSLPLCDKQMLEVQDNLQKSKSAFVTNCYARGPKVLIFRDSFFTALQPYISQYFSKSLYVADYPEFRQIERYVRFHSPDIIIEEWVERHLEKIPNLPKPQDNAYNLYLENCWKKGKDVYRFPRNHPNELSGMHQMEINAIEQGYRLESHGDDPSFQLPEVNLKSGRHIIRMELGAPQSTKWQIFYPQNNSENPIYSEKNSKSGFLQKGDNIIYSFIDGKVQGKIRIDPGTMPGVYIVKAIEIRTMGEIKAPPLQH